VRLLQCVHVLEHVWLLGIVLTPRAFIGIPVLGLCALELFLEPVRVTGVLHHRPLQPRVDGSHTRSLVWVGVVALREQLHQRRQAARTRELRAEFRSRCGPRTRAARHALEQQHSEATCGTRFSR